MTTGIEIIAQKRKEQVEEHGYTIDHDIFYTNEELQGFALSIILSNQFYFPSTWDKIHWEKVMAKSRIEQLGIAGALLAAEIDVKLHIES